MLGLRLIQTMKNFRPRKKTLILAFLCAAVLLLPLVAAFEEANHDCTGEDCPICLHICDFRNTLEHFGVGIISTALILAVPPSGGALFTNNINRPKRANLVLLKIKLNN